MPSLVAPAACVRESFLAAVAEYQREGRYTDLDVRVLAAPAAFAGYLRELAAGALPDRLRPRSVVAQTTLWWVDGAVFLGRVSIRHRLTDRLRQVGGHIGYDVAPAARRRSHATTMLRAALPVAAALGIDPALVTCDVDNVASRKVIEANGGRLWQASNGTMRFWVPTGGLTPTRAADDSAPDANMSSASAGKTFPGRAEFDRDHLGAVGEQVAGGLSGAGPDLQHVGAWPQAAAAGQCAVHLGGIVRAGAGVVVRIFVERRRQPLSHGVGHPGRLRRLPTPAAHAPQQAR